MTTTKKNLFPRLAPGIVSFLRASVLAAAVMLLCWQLTVGTGVLMALVAALGASIAADVASRTRLRLPSVLGICLVTLLVGVFLARLLVKSALLADLVGPVVALWLAEGALWLFLTAPSIFALRFAAARKSLLAVAEVLVVAAAVAWTLAAHRGGMVHRPLSIGDWAWSRGVDPVLVLLILGVGGVFLLAALLISERRPKRLPLHFGMLAALALALLLVVRVTGVPKPQAAGDLGLTGDPDEEAEARPDEGEGEGDEQQNDPSDELGDLQFKDNYKSDGRQAPVAVVLLHDDYSPPAGVYYFRQSAFSQYNGRRLVQATRDDVDRDVVARFPVRPVKISEAPPLSDRRSALRTSMGLLIDHVRPFALDSPAALRPIPNPDPMRFQRAFDVLSHVQTMPYDEMVGLLPGDPDWSGEQWDFYTDAPSDPRYRELADQLMTRLRDEYKDDPLAQALAIKTYFDEEGIYSLKSRHATADDPAASFLFGDLTGYCVHFAHAATYMMRSRGLPARVAAGYAISESARGGGSTLMVRGADAHAWPELYLEGVGWVVVDPAPQQTLDEPGGPPDQTLQRMLGEMMRQSFKDEMDFEEARAFFDWNKIKRFVLMALFLLVAAAYAVKFYRTLVPFFSRPLRLYRVAYRASLDRLAEVGWKRRFGESRESFGERAAAVSPSFGRMTEEHLRWALGSRERGEPSAFSQLMVTVERDIRQRFPAWRRFVGFLNPVSWILVR